MLNPLVPPSSVSTSATPAAAGELFIGRLLTVLVALDGLISEHGPSRGRVHGLRVAARRAEAALAGFASALDEMPALKVRRMLKRLRRSAGRARDADVALPRLQQHCEAASGKALKAAERVLESARDERREAYAELTVMAREFPRRRFERLIHRLTERSAVMALEPKVAARQAIHDAVVDARAQAAQGLTGDETLHRLRLKLKRLRYAVELFALVLPADPVEAVLVRLREASDALGAVSDGMAMRLRLQAQKGRGGLAALLTTHNRHQRNARARAVQVWRRLERDAVLDSLEEVVLDAPADRAPAPTASVPQVPIEPVGESASAVRLAAIDMGTNSIRLIVAEALRDGTYRILDDEKEVARLGRGLEHTGRMDERAMEQAAFAVARMKRIAEGFGVRAVRAVATSAAREAANGSELIKMVRRWAGLEVRVISAEEEAQLAFESVARAFDLSALCAAVVDIGGGSTQITLTRGGIAERVWTLPIGAVRLTERFGGAAACSGGRWREMLKWLGGEWAEAMSASSANAKSEIEPQLIIGTGGTMTALGNIALAEETAGPDHSRGSGAAHGSGPPAGALQGYELKVGEIKRIVGSLRGMTLEERARVPGLSADRADIIVAGGAIAFEKSQKAGKKPETKKQIAATMLGNSTRPLMWIKKNIEPLGCDLVIFHANGVGGPAMEELIEQGVIHGVIDYTLSEIIGEIGGGFHMGGPARMDAAGKAGLPQLIVPGSIDFLVFGRKETIPENIRNRPTHYHNPEFTLVRCSREEQLQAARFVAGKLNASKGKVVVIVPCLLYTSPSPRD